MSDLVERCDEDWGDPEENRRHLVPFPSRSLTSVLHGINMQHGDMIGIMGQEKNRKTTLAMNILHHIYTAERPLEKPRTVFFTLESGQDPARVRDLFIAMKATELMAEMKYGPMPQGGVLQGEWVQNCVDDPELCLSPEYLHYRQRTPLQMRAIQDAREIVAAWDMYVVGTAIKEGGSRDLERTLRAIEAHAQEGARMIVVDHLQQFHVQGVTNAYDRLRTIVERVSQVAAEHKLVCLALSQVSLTSVRDKRQGMGDMQAAGGSKLGEEATVLLSTEYEGGDKMTIRIHTSRRSGTAKVVQVLDRESGLFLGEGRLDG